MFSGIVEEYATLVALVKDQENIHFTFKCSFVNELKIDQSISHNGVCLTVVSLTDDTYTVTAMKETLERSNLGLLKVGDKVNVERSMMMNGRLDGHIVQGHVDQTATCIDIKDAEERAKAATVEELFAKILTNPKYKDVYLITPDASDAHETSVDGTHPSSYGYALWAKSIETPVIEILSKYGIK